MYVCIANIIESNPCLPLRVKQIVINNGTYKYFEIKYSVANCLSE